VLGRPALGELPGALSGDALGAGRAGLRRNRPPLRAAPAPGHGATARTVPEAKRAANMPSTGSGSAAAAHSGHGM